MRSFSMDSSLDLLEAQIDFNKCSFGPRQGPVVIGLAVVYKRDLTCSGETRTVYVP